MSKISTSKITQQSLKGAMLRGELVFEPLFTVADAGVNIKTFHVWKSKGLVQFINRGTWARLSLVELIWLRMLESMRRFGCSVNLMKKLYDHYFTRAFEENLAEKTIIENIQYYVDLSSQRQLTEDESAVMENLIHISKDESLKMILRSEISYFSHLIMKCLRNDEETGIIIYEDGSFEDYTLYNGAQPRYDPRPSIRIPISGYLLDIINDESKEEFLAKTALFDEYEYRVIKEMRNKNVQSITINFSHDKHKPEKITVDKSGVISGDDVKEIKAILGLKNYSSIELKTRDENTLSFTYKEKKFL